MWLHFLATSAVPNLRIKLLSHRVNILVRLDVLDSWSMSANLHGIWFTRTNICAAIETEVQGKVISYLKLLFKGR